MKDELEIKRPKNFNNWPTVWQSCFNDGVEACKAALPSETAKDQQHTKCAICLEDKNTPLRRDEMDGYVCLTCIDKQLDKNMETIAAQKRQIEELKSELAKKTGNDTDLLTGH